MDCWKVHYFIPTHIDGDTWNWRFECHQPAVIGRIDILVNDGDPAKASKELYEHISNKAYKELHV